MAEPEPATPRTNPYSRLHAASSATGTDSKQATGEAKIDDDPTGGERRITWNLWALMPLLSLGFLTPLTFIIAAKRVRQRRMRATDAVYSVIWLAMIIGWCVVYLTL